MHYLNDSISLWNCCNEGQLLNKKVIMKCLAIKMCAWNFLQLPIQKYNCNSTHSYNRKTCVDIPSYIIFPCTYTNALQNKKNSRSSFWKFYKNVLRSVLLGSSTSRTKGDHLIDLMWRLVIVFFARLSHTTSTVITQL